jgi:hypothetical protein
LLTENCSNSRLVSAVKVFLANDGGFGATSCAEGTSTLPSALAARQVSGALPCAAACGGNRVLA